MVIKRDYYVNQVLAKRWNGKVKIITGLRRCGKSYLLSVLYKEVLLSEGVSESDIIDSQKPAPEYRPEDEIKLAENRPEGQKTAQTKVGKTAQSIIDILVSDQHCTRTELCSRLGKSDGTIKEHLAKLQERGIVQRVGPDFGGYWKVLIRN